MPTPRQILKAHAVAKRQAKEGLKIQIGSSVRFHGEVGTVKEIDEDGDPLIEVPSRVYPLWVPVEAVEIVKA